MWWKVDFILQLVMNQLSSWTEKKLQSTFLSQTCTQKRSWSLFGGLQLVWKPLQLSESWENHYIWEVCSANRWDALETAMPAASIGQHKRPNCPPQPVKWIGLWSFASFAIFTWPLTNQLPLLQASQQLFAAKMLLQPVGGRKCLLRVHWILRHGF